MKNLYIQHKGKVINKSSKFTHVMAITLDPRSKHKDGVLRCIVDRSGDVSVAGYIDRSELRMIHGNTHENFKIGNKLNIKNESEIIKKISGKGYEFIGLEDPDIWMDEKKNLIHLYFTIPLISKENKKSQIHLGHAVGKSLSTLEMTMPILKADKVGGAKELSIAPVNKKGFRYNLVESSKKEKDFHYSVVRVATAKDMGKPWKFGKIVFHPKKHSIPWIGGHASPGPLFSRDFIDIAPGKVLGIMNGREANKKVGLKTKYGMFSVGLFIYDYEKGKIDWVSSKPLIQDSEAKTITFASQFVETKKGEGILYAHVDDSFVRAYTLKARDLKKILPQ